MFSKQISTAAILLVLCIFATTIVKAQSAPTSPGGWAARVAHRKAIEPQGSPKRDADVTVVAADDVEYHAAAGAGSQDVLERYKEGRRKALIGTWRIHITESEAGFPAFNAFHSFHEGGTFTEVSDLLPGLNETPASGVWDLDGGRFILTFELFAFENKQPVGIVRVRCIIDVFAADQLRGTTVVDFIDLDGTEILAIDAGPFTGKKIRPLLLGN